MQGERIGLIGLGLLGAAIAEQLSASGFSVFGFDIDDQRLAAFSRSGGESGESAADVVGTCTRIVLSLPDSTVVRGVLEEIEPARLAGRLVMDTTTGAPEDAAAFGRVLEAAGGHYLDTTIGGSSDQVRNREAIIIAGADSDALIGACRCFAAWDGWSFTRARAAAARA